MLNSAINYPYPVLRTNLEDYDKSTFCANVTVDPTTEGYRIFVKYDVNNAEVIDLLEKGDVTFALEIQCISTWYRRLELSDCDEQTIFLQSNMIHDRVDLCPCIVARKNIKDFYSDDFSEEYKNIPFSINTGEVIAIGERKKFEALYKDDIIKKSESIVHFQDDNKADIMYCEWDNPIIQIHIPTKQYALYTHMGQYESWKVPLLNAIYVTPVIVEALTYIYQDECKNGDNSLSEYAWYKTLKFLTGKIAKNDSAKYKKLLGDPLKLAQLLLNDNASISLELLGSSSKQ